MTDREERDAVAAQGVLHQIYAELFGEVATEAIGLVQQSQSALQVQVSSLPLPDLFRV